jgi:two-component system NtrC family sensor kinase
MLGSAASEAADIIGQLLQLSRPPAAHFVGVDLNHMVRETIDFLRFEARESGCSIRPELASGPALVRADPAQLKQVLINLTINAIHASEQAACREVTLAVRLRGDRCEVAVIDQGHGIPAEISGKIFEAFFTTKDHGKGSGLGLSVCQSIVKFHNGNMQVHSEVGVGTTMRFDLPAFDDRAVLMRVEKAYCCPERPGLDCRKSRVLIVDDERYLTALIEKCLQRELGLQTTVAGDGAEAIDCLRKGDYDLLISDVRMPGVDGFELFAWTIENRPDLVTRFLFITGDAGGHQMNDRLSSLPVPVLRKPFSIDTLFDRCVELLA